MNRIYLIAIIGIPLAIIGFYITNHDDFTRGNNAEASLESMASTDNCVELKFILQDENGTWFPAKYVQIAEERMVELKC